MGLGEIGLAQAGKSSPELAVAPLVHMKPLRFHVCVCVCVASVWRPGTVLGLLLWWAVTVLTNISRAVGGGVRAAVAAPFIGTASLHVQLLSTMVVAFLSSCFLVSDWWVSRTLVSCPSC